MAFVYRSEKITIISPQREESQIGPGQYLSQDNPQLHKIKQNKAPFLSVSKKGEKTINKRNCPGPGSYFIEENKKRPPINEFKSQKEIQKLETIKALQNLNHEDLSNLSEIINLKNSSENLGFSVKETRFKQDPNSYLPGPGYYLKTKDEIQSDKFKLITTDFKKMNKNPVYKSDVNDNKKIVSIPNKFQSYGYLLQEDGNIVMNQDPETFKKFKGDKHDSVGPGNYDVVKTLTWYKKGTVWSKSKTPKIFNDNKEKNKSYNTSTNFNSKLLSKSFDNGCHDDSKNFKRNASQTGRTYFPNENKAFKSSQVLKSNKVRKHNRKSNYNEIFEIMDFPNKSDLLQKNISSETPGPGYYYNSNNSKTGYYLSTHNNFLSNQERFKERIDTTSLGPGSYFREEDKINLTKIFKRDKSHALIKTRDKSTTASTTSIPNIPGPGQYDPDINIKGRKTFSTQSYFGSTEKRFAHPSIKKKENIPGPGYYYPNNDNPTGYNWLEDKLLLKNLKNRKVIYERPKIIKKNDTRKHSAGNDVPPVGAYNPHHLFNIDYKIHKKLNRLTLVETAFNTNIGKDRFNSDKEDNNGGPGFYYKDKKVQKKQVYPPFKATDRRFGENRLHMAIIGPGSYHHSSYHDWNKKTFNLLYL